MKSAVNWVNENVDSFLRDIGDFFGLGGGGSSYKVTISHYQLNGPLPSGSSMDTGNYMSGGGNSTITPFRVGTEWLTGNGPRIRNFKGGDIFTEMLRKHEHVQDTRNIIINRIINGEGLFSGSNPYELGGVKGVGLYIKDYSTLLTGGLTGNLAVTYLGSYNLNYQVVNINKDSARIHFSVKNSSTMQSASRPPILGYFPIWQNNVGAFINNYFSTGWGSKTTQTFSWYENLYIH